jgi:sec-independent protein translocase protein TatA
MVGLDNPLHIAILVLVLLMIFGAKRLPEMGRSLGAGMRGFKESITGETRPEPSAKLPASSRESAAAAPSEPAEARPST